MATRRRPRTRVYDCNFNIGQSYYKPVMDSLDRKYSGRSQEPAAERDGPLSKFLGDIEREGTPSSRASKLFADMDGVEQPSFRSRAPLVDDDDAAIDAEFEDTMKRIRASRAARNAELEEEFDSYAQRKKINIADGLLDSVGLNSRAQRALEDDVIYKQKRSAARKFMDEDDDKVTRSIRPLEEPKKFNIADGLLESVGLDSRAQREIEDAVIYKQKRSAARRFLKEDDEKVDRKLDVTKKFSMADGLLDSVGLSDRVQKAVNDDAMYSYAKKFLDEDDEEGSINNRKLKGSKKLNFADGLLDSVGINSKTQKEIEEDVMYKKKRSSARKYLEEKNDKVVTKWTAVRPGARALQEAEDAVEENGAVARARKSRARIQDIDNELEELAAKGAARQRRIQELRALVGEDDSSSTSSSLKVSKRVTVKSSSEKKQVSF